MTASATYFSYNTPIGHITIASNGRWITQIALGVQKLSGKNTATPLTNLASNQVQEYLAGKRYAFTVDYRAEGSDFQRKVWDAITTIPYGQTRTFTHVAASVGHPNSQRAVGMAVASNPIPFIIAHHRVVASDGNPTGTGVDAKLREYLLLLEATHGPHVC